MLTVVLTPWHVALRHICISAAYVRDIYRPEKKFVSRICTRNLHKCTRLMPKNKYVTYAFFFPHSTYSFVIGSDLSATQAET